MIAKIKELMYEPDQIRNIGICAHIDHGKTTLSDNLLAGAGMISEELAGDQRFLDFDEQEQARGITIDAANVSMVHDYKEKEYLINLLASMKIFRNLFCNSSGSNFNSLINLSTLLMNKTGLTFSFKACLNTVSV